MTNSPAIRRLSVYKSVRAPVSDKFTRPTNGLMQAEYDRLVASGKVCVTCPGCHVWRWLEASTVQMPDFLCDTCLMDGVPRDADPLPVRGELTSRQREKKT